MSEEKKTRTVEEIGADYTRLAVKAGDLTYKIYSFKRDLELLTNAMQELNFEATAAHAESVKSASAATQAPEAPVTAEESKDA